MQICRHATNSVLSLILAMTLAWLSPVSAANDSQTTIIRLATTTSTEKGDTLLLLNLTVMNVLNGRRVYIGSFRPTTSFLRDVIPFFDQYQRSATIWSPDSRYLVINMVTGDEKPGVFVLSVSDKPESHFIEYGTMPFWSWK